MAIRLFGHPLIKVPAPHHQQLNQLKAQHLVDMVQGLGVI